MKISLYFIKYVIPKAQEAEAKLQNSEIIFKTRNVLFIRKRRYRQYRKTSVATLAGMRGTAVEPIDYGNYIEDRRLYVQKDSPGRRRESLRLTLAYSSVNRK